MRKYRSIHKYFIKGIFYVTNTIFLNGTERSIRYRRSKAVISPVGDRQTFMKLILQIKTILPHNVLSIFAAFLTLLLCSCTTVYQNRYFPVNNLAQRESSLGFSITPPAGKHWYEKLNNNSLYYLKKTNQKDYAIYTKATEIHLRPEDLKADRFLAFVLKSKKLNNASGDFQNISLRIIQTKALSPLCIRYIQIYEDHSAKYLGKDEYVNIKNSGLVCMHPDTPRNGVDMYYVESSLKSSENPINDLNEEGESFLKSLKFHPLGT